MRSTIDRRRLLPLAGFAAAVAAVWTGIHVVDVWPWDRWILLYISAVYLLAVLVMLLGTRIWSARGLGLLGTALGDAGLYLGVARARFGGPPLARWELDLVRALFLVGGTLLLAGLVWWLADWLRGRPTDAAIGKEYTCR